MASSIALTVADVAAAQTSTVHDQSTQIDLRSGPLADILVELGDLLNLTIVAPNSIVAGKTAPAISGAFTAEQALNIALAGSSLKAQATSDGVILISEDVAPEPAQKSRYDSVETVIVRGTKQDLSLQDTVESVEVFTAKRFDEENLFDISDALTRTPNVSTIRGELNGVSIRGINRQGTNSAGTGLAINVFQDGVPLSNQALRFGAASAWDVEQLEVLRGSQSNVQGRNSIAGAIVLQSKKPNYDWEAAARLRLAEFGTLQAAGAISGPIIADQLAFRMSADYQETDGFVVDQFSDEPFDFKESLTVRGRILAEPQAISGLSALLTVEYNERSNGDQPEVRSQAGDLNFDPQARVTFDERKNTNDFESVRAIADISYAFDDSITLKLLGTYDNVDSLNFTTSRAPGEADQETFRGDLSIETYSAEVRLEFDFGKLSGFLGAYYFDDALESRSLSTLVISDFVPFLVNPSDSVFRIDSQSLTDVENFAFFTSLRYEPSDKWTLDFALRYDDERRTFERPDSAVVTDPDTCLITAPGFVLGLPTSAFVTVPCSLAESQIAPETDDPLQTNEFGVLLPSGSVTYHFTEDASIFAGYRRGYRAGGTFLAQSNSAIAPPEVRSYDSEFLDTFEAGWRTQWLNQRLTFNGTAFYSEYKDQQVAFRDNQGFNEIANAGATSLYGLELSASFEATPELDLTASVGLLETNVDDFLVQEDDPATPENELLNVAGNDLDRSPNLTFNLGANYQSQNGFFAGANVNYQSSYFSDIFNLEEADLGDGLTEKVDAAAIVNAQAGYSFSDVITVTVYANNLFDEGSPDRIGIGGIGAALTPGTIGNLFGFTLRQPQTFGVTVDVRF